MVEPNPKPPRHIRRALVVTKETRLAEIRDSGDAKAIGVLDKDTPLVAKIKTAHDKHYASLACVQRVLAELGIEFKLVGMSGEEEKVEEFDIVIAVGGDGTFLYASHHFGGTVPLLGVNSSYPESAGHFCLAHTDNFRQTLASIIDGTLDPIGLARLKLTLDGKVLPHRPLNEVYAGHHYSAGTARYTITIGDISEPHKGGGMLVGTASGSTGWLDSVGGKNLPITDTRLQYSVRSVIHSMGRFGRNRLKLHRGILSSGSQVKIISGMSGNEGVLAIDGAWIRYDFPLGAELVVEIDDLLLPAYLDPNAHDIYLAHPYWDDPSLGFHLQSAWDHLRAVGTQFLNGIGCCLF